MVTNNDMQDIELRKNTYLTYREETPCEGARASNRHGPRGPQTAPSPPPPSQGP